MMQASKQFKASIFICPINKLMQVVVLCSVIAECVASFV